MQKKFRILPLGPVWNHFGELLLKSFCSRTNFIFDHLTEIAQKMCIFKCANAYTSVQNLKSVYSLKQNQGPPLADAKNPMALGGPKTYQLLHKVDANFVMEHGHMDMSCIYIS